MFFGSLFARKDDAITLTLFCIFFNQVRSNSEKQRGKEEEKEGFSIENKEGTKNIEEKLN